MNVPKHGSYLIQAQKVLDFFKSYYLYYVRLREGRNCKRRRRYWWLNFNYNYWFTWYSSLFAIAVWRVPYLASVGWVKTQQMPKVVWNRRTAFSDAPMAFNKIARKDSDFYVICTLPDFCWAPPPAPHVTPPVPFSLFADLSGAKTVAKDVRLTRKPAFVFKASKTNRTTGDEPAARAYFPAPPPNLPGRWCILLRLNPQAPHHSYRWYVLHEQQAQRKAAAQTLYCL